MEINKDTKIKYEILDKRSKEKSFITVSMEQIEGSVPNFYEQIQKTCNLNPETTEIIKREIVEEK